MLTLLQLLSWVVSPQPEEMTKLRSLNRQLQINVDCTLKEVDLLQSRGIELTGFEKNNLNTVYA